MTTLPGRPRTALLVLDVQRGALTGTLRRDEVVANIQLVLERARAQGAPVIWTRHGDDHLPPGSQEWQLVSELQPLDGEALLDKTYSDAFEESDLEAVLARLHVGRLIVVGAQTDECIRSTLHGAIVRGYDATLVSDAHTTEDQQQWGGIPPEQVITHTNLYWTHHVAPGRTAGTVETRTVDLGAGDVPSSPP